MQIFTYASKDRRKRFLILHNNMEDMESMAQKNVTDDLNSLWDVSSLVLFLKFKFNLFIS